MSQGGFTQEVQKRIAEENARLLQWHQEKRSDDFLRGRSDFIDSLLLDFFNDLDKKNLPPLSLISLGGYGRRELAVASDIDLLFLYEGRSGAPLKKATEKILYPLWDAGLEVGFATRTITDCRRIAEEDITALTALVDARFLTGEAALFKKLQQDFWKRVRSERGKRDFWEKKSRENQERLAKFGGSVYLLEPNLKEGEGGLRDYQNILWVGKVFEKINSPDDLVAKGWIPASEAGALKEAIRFLTNTRNELHRLSGRKNDQLSLQYQETLAHWWGLEEAEGIIPVERFMQRYYHEAAIIHEWSSRLTRRWAEEPGRLLKLFPLSPETVDGKFKIIQGKLSLADSNLFFKDPVSLLRIFQIFQKEGLEIDDYTQDKIRESVFLMDSIRESPEAGAVFRGILGEPRRLGPTLLLMNELKVLGQYLPEFAKLRFRVQHDVYHVYTVDIHSIFAVAELGKIDEYKETYPVGREALKDVAKKDLLALAILYHDIGKGAGSGHVEKGVPLIREAGRRLGFSAEEIDLLEFLEKSHLIMPHLAFRRDLEDQNMIIQFARSFPSLEALSMLTLLTFCDIKAVGPATMTPWKSALLENLYRKTREVLVKGTFDKEKVSTLVDRVKKESEKLLGRSISVEEQSGFFSAMPSRYLLAAPPAEIIRHLALWKKFKKEELPVLDHRNRAGFSELTIFSWNTPQLFSRICGVTAANSVNILEVQSTVNSQGEALYNFIVEDLPGGPILDDRKWERVLRDLRQVIEGKSSIDRMVQERLRPSLIKPKTARKVPTKIEIDNDISAYYTVIDIYAHDRIGLLYRIISTLTALGLYVDISKISTKVDQASDTFYVKDIFGQKITSQDRLKKIKEDIAKTIAEAS